MKSYHINKGIGSTVEFKGLKAQYLFLFAGGLLGLLLLVLVLYMFGVHSYVCLGIAVGGGGLIVRQTFHLNGKYGAHGLMKLGASKRHPRYLIRRRSIRAQLCSTKKKLL